MASVTLTPASVSDVAGGTIAWTNVANAADGSTSTYAAAQQAATANAETNRLRFDLTSAIASGAPRLMTGAVRNSQVNVRRRATFSGGGTGDNGVIKAAFVHTPGSPARLATIDGPRWSGSTTTVVISGTNADLVVDSITANPWLPAGLTTGLSDFFAVDVWEINPASGAKSMLLELAETTVTIDYEPGPITAGLTTGQLTPASVTSSGGSWTNLSALVGASDNAAATSTFAGATGSTTIKATHSLSSLPADANIVELRVKVVRFKYDMSAEPNETPANPCDCAVTVKCGAGLSTTLTSAESWTGKYMAEATAAGQTQVLNNTTRTFSFSTSLPTAAQLKAGCEVWVKLDATGNDAGGGAYDTARWTVQAVLLEVRYNSGGVKGSKTVLMGLGGLQVS